MKLARFRAKSALSIAFLASFLVLISLVFTGAHQVYADDSGTSPTPATQAVYRAYNPATGEHLYISDLVEAYTLQQAGWNFEGGVFQAFSTGTPVYRLYNPVSGQHVYSVDSNEYNTLASEGWNNEGICFYAEPTPQASTDIPVYRLYNSATGQHLLSTDANEYATLGAHGWEQEGIAWYEAAAGTNATLSAASAVTPATDNTGSGSFAVTITATAANGTQVTNTRNYSYQISEAPTAISGGINLSITGLTGFVSKVQFPTWATANNQKDIVWYDAAAAGGGSYTATYNGKSHGLVGQYQTDVYAMVLGSQVKLGTITYNVSYEADPAYAQTIIESAIANGMALVGKSPYDWAGGRTPESIAANSFDCSSFVSEMFARAGYVIDNQEMTTTNSLINRGIPVSWNDLQRGDIILMDDAGDAHVAIYLGNNTFLHDSPQSSTGGVGVNNFSDINASYNESWGSLFQNHLVGIRRLVF